VERPAEEGGEVLCPHAKDAASSAATPSRAVMWVRALIERREHTRRLALDL
jgi:hypothetical protein